MSRGLPQDPIVTRSGSVKIATPPPPLKLAAIVVDPICSQQSGDIEVYPEPPPNN